MGQHGTHETRKGATAGSGTFRPFKLLTPSNMRQLELTPSSLDWQVPGTNQNQVPEAELQIGPEVLLPF